MSLEKEFATYYDLGIKKLQNNNFIDAKKDILKASEILLNLAKDSEGVKKVRYIRRSKELLLLVDDLTQKIDSIATKPTEEAKTVIPEKKVEKKDSKPISNKILLDDIAGLDDVKKQIKNLVVDPLKYPDIYQVFKKNKGGGILLYGVPGTGKTMIAQAIASEIDAHFIEVKSSDIASKWFGDSEKNIKELFSEARSHKVSIIFFDEFEALGMSRDNGSSAMKRVVPELLSQMQGFEKSDTTLVVIAATNRPWDIDSAFLRPGRFNTRIHVPVPDYDARKFILEKNLLNVPVKANLDFNHITKQTKGFNGSDVVELCEKIKTIAIERSILSNTISEITNNDVETALKDIRTSVVSTDLDKMNAYQNKDL